MFGGAHPLSKIFSIGQGYATCNNARFVSGLSFYIPSPRCDYLVRWPDFAANHLNFICNQESKVLNVLPLPPPSRDDIPLETTHIRMQTIMEPIKHTCVGVQTITSPFSSKRKSALISPIRLTISFPSCNFPNFAFHSFHPKFHHLLIRFNADGARRISFAP